LSAVVGGVVDQRDRLGDGGCPIEEHWRGLNRRNADKRLFSPGTTMLLTLYPAPDEGE
jgi:hypothetical protein